MRYFGLDGEMSGSEIGDGHKLIQIGVCVDTDNAGNRLRRPELFVSLIGWEPADLPWDARAAKVHNIPIDAIHAAPRAPEVDEALASWLRARGLDPSRRRDNIMVGFNVGAFDAPFLQAALPETASMFSRRYGDLNPLTFLLGGVVPVQGGQPASAKTWRRYIKNFGRVAVKEFGRVEAEHDAGTDALMALAGFRALQEHQAALAADAANWRCHERERRKSTAAAR